MKFGKILQGEHLWSQQYVSYAKFKRLIKRHKFIREERRDNRERKMGEGSKVRRINVAASEGSPLLGSREEASPGAEDQEKGLMQTYSEQDLKADAAEFLGEVMQETVRVEAFYRGMLAEITSKVQAFEGRQHMTHTWSVPSGNTYSQIKRTYKAILALKQFTDLNGEGFRKIVKKYDKTMGTQYLAGFMEELEKHSFYRSKEPYALEERVEALVSRDKLIEMKTETQFSALADTEPLCPNVKLLPLALSLVLFLLALHFPLVPQGQHASRCGAVLVLVTSMWITEAVPYFVTSLLVPILVVLLDVLEVPEHRGSTLDRRAAAQLVLSHMVNHTTILIMGGYSISAAFSRCEIELRIASVLQQIFGHRPRLFILSFMYLGLFLSAMVNNHTAPVLCASVMIPIVRDCPPGSAFSKALLLGLAFACNFGGMVTPIASMQNVVSVQTLEFLGYRISFGLWIAMALPFSMLGVALVWLLLMITLQPDDVKSIPVIVHSKKQVFSPRNIAVLLCTTATILLWSTFSYTGDTLGDLGIISLLFMVLAFGSGLLTEVDFNSFSWHTLFLLGGGNVLGKAISDSRLLHYLAKGIVHNLPRDNQWLLLVEMVCATVVIATFVSHTVSAIILMPIIIKIGVDVGMPVQLGVCSALAVSAASALPFSSFPNVMSLLQTDDFNHPYLTVTDFLKSGIPASLLAIAMIITMG
ncbi:unnamed protein product [Chrysoparadoxa australica]